MKKLGEKKKKREEKKKEEKKGEEKKIKEESRKWKRRERRKNRLRGITLYILQTFYKKNMFKNTLNFKINFVVKLCDIFEKK